MIDIYYFYTAIAALGVAIFAIIILISIICDLEDRIDLLVHDVIGGDDHGAKS